MKTQKSMSLHYGKMVEKTDKKPTHTTSVAILFLYDMKTHLSSYFKMQYEHYKEDNVALLCM